MVRPADLPSRPGTACTARGRALPVAAGLMLLLASGARAEVLFQPHEIVIGTIMAVGRYAVVGYWTGFPPELRHSEQAIGPSDDDPETVRALLLGKSVICGRYDGPPPYAGGTTPMQCFVIMTDAQNMPTGELLTLWDLRGQN